jgi:hypothetical protein
MKKTLVIALVVAVGVSAAFASTIKIPWFVDAAPAGCGFPPSSGILGLCYLSSSSSEVLECSIEYFNEAGESLGPAEGENTFTIQPLSTVAFRPVIRDPNPTAIAAGAAPNTADGGYENGDGGQEGPQGVLVPKLPNGYSLSNPTGAKPNGSLTVYYEGEGLLSGQYTLIGGPGFDNVGMMHLLPD